MDFFSEDSDFLSDFSFSSFSDFLSDSFFFFFLFLRKRKYLDFESENLKDFVKKRRGSFDYDNRFESKRDRF